MIQRADKFLAFHEFKFEMHTGPFEGFGPEPTWFQKFQVFLMQPCGLFQLLSCSHLAFPSPGISGYVAPWQVYGTSPVGQSISKLSKYHGRGSMDTKQKARSSSSVSRAGALVNPIFCTPDLYRKVHSKIKTYKTPFVLARAPCPAIESIWE